MTKRLILTILWVAANLLIYMAMMAADSGSSVLLFKALRVVLVTSLLTMVMSAMGWVKFEKTK